MSVTPLPRRVRNPAPHCSRASAPTFPARYGNAAPAVGKIGFVSLLLVTAVLYFWNLSINDYGNSFYAAAAQAGADNWTAFFFGSSDMANSITVDKTPLSLWPMMLAVKIFGLNSYSLLGPEALLGVASVALLYHTVRRHHGVPAALIAGWALALTPVATLMFRFNNLMRCWCS